MTSAPTLFGGKAPTPVPWHPLPHMEEWLDELEASEVTDVYARQAKRALAYFALFAQTEGIKHPDEIRRPHILRFQAYLTGRTKEDGSPLALSYRQQMLKYLRNWINWLGRLDYITTNPWVQIRVGTSSKKPNPLEDDEIELIFEAHRHQAFQIRPFFYHRREAILILLYGWGLRIGELESLTVTQMDTRQDFVTVRNKARAGSANKEKVLPYSEEMKMVVLRWLVHRGEKAVPQEDALFIDQQGMPQSQQMIRKIITDCGRRAGVTINPHRLRDTYATTLLDNDVPIERIMRLLGHSSEKQVLAYAKVRDPKLKESHDQVMSPLLNRLLGGVAP